MKSLIKDKIRVMALFVFVFFSSVSYIDILSCTKSLKILLTNDDGIHAAGLTALKKTLEKEHNIAVMAPFEEQSAQGHKLSLGRELEVIDIDRNVYACSGSPADCVILGFEHIYSPQNTAPDLVISGINHANNLGQNIYYSGTVAAAREAAIQGLPAMAVSLAVKSTSNDYHFETAAELVQSLLLRNVHQILEEGDILNINVPNIPFEQLNGIKVTDPAHIYYRIHIKKKDSPQGRSIYQYDGKECGFSSLHKTISDCRAIEQLKASLSLIQLFPSRSKRKKKLLMKKILNP